MGTDSVGVNAGVDLRLLSDPALAYVADVYMQHVTFVRSTLQLSPLASRWVALRREFPEMFRIESAVGYLPVPDPNAPSGMCIRIVGKELGMSADELERAVEKDDVIGGITLGPSGFTSADSAFLSSDIPKSIDAFIGEIDYPDLGKAVPLEEALELALTDIQAVPKLPGYCYLYHLPESKWLEAMRILRSDPTLGQLDAYAVGVDHALSSYGRANVGAVRTSTGWHMIQASNDLGMLTPGEVVDDVVGVSSAWTNLIKPEHAQEFIKLGRPITVADMEACDPKWLRSDVVLWSYGFVRDPVAWYVIQENGTLPSWVGKISDDSIIGRDEEVGSWYSLGMSGIRVFNVTMSFELGLFDVVEVDLGNTGEANCASGKVVVRPLAGEVQNVNAVTPLVVYATGAVLRSTDLVVDGLTDTTRFRMRYDRRFGMKSTTNGTKVRIKALVPTTAGVGRVGSSANVSNWRLVDVGGQVAVSSLDDFPPDVGWMVSSGRDYQADVTYRFATSGRVWYFTSVVECGDSGKLYGDVLDAAVSHVSLTLGKGNLNGLTIGVKINSFVAVGDGGGGVAA